MATLHYIVTVKDARTLELPEEARSLGLRPGDQLEVIVEQTGTLAEPPVVNDAGPGEQNLAEALKDYIGCFDFGDANLSEDTGRKFAELLFRKHRSGKL